MSDLIERVEKATGPDEDIDADVFEAFGGEKWDLAYRRATQPCGCPHETAVSTARLYAPEYTASIDAVCALIAEKLPKYTGHGYERMSGNPHTVGRVILAPECPDAGATDRRSWSRHVEAAGATPALALLAAALRAMEHPHG
jgi:hypothetical protein